MSIFNEYEIVSDTKCSKKLEKKHFKNNEKKSMQNVHTDFVIHEKTNLLLNHEVFFMLKNGTEIFFLQTTMENISFY